jgi:hypothetical protein
MFEAALHGQGQNSQVLTRCHGKPCRGLLLCCTILARLVIACQN